MPVTTYATLKAAIVERMDRSSFSAGGQADEFIDLAEADFNRTLRHHEMEEETTLALNSSGKASLPSDFLFARSARWAGSPKIELTPVSMGGRNNLSPSDTSGTPEYFDISGTTFRVTPPSSGNVTLTYYEKVPALSSSTGSTTNWLLDLAPNLYLFQALAHGYTFTMEFGIADRYGALAGGILENIKSLDEQARYHNAEVVLDFVTDQG